MNEFNAFVPIYQKLSDLYRELILTQKYSPGSRIDSINEIQKRHGVSRETAKLVLNKLSDQGLIVQKAGKGSYVADLGPRKKVWGVIIPFFSAHVENMLFYLGFEANKFGRTIEHYVSYNSWKEEVRLNSIMINQRYEAVIVVPTFDETKTAEYYRRLVSGGTVVTLLDHTMAGSYFTYAIQSYDLGVKRAVHYLLDRKDGALVFIKNNTWADRNMVQEVMEETFINFVDQHYLQRKAFVIDRIQDLSREFLQNNKIDGIFCCDDIDAVKVIGRVKEWNYRLPEDISVISYGNTDLAQYFTPAITSIDSHCEEMAHKTANIIKAHINGEDVRFCQYVIQPELIIRKT
jgi:DNA-binding LacI/PurR family transcriptional regulator